MKPQNVPMLARCIVVTGTLPCGILMYRLNAWTPTIEFEGKMWNARSLESLHLETALTKKQLRSAVTLAVKRGYLETKQLRFKGANVFHFRVTDLFLKEAQNVTIEYEYAKKKPTQSAPQGELE